MSLWKEAFPKTFTYNKHMRGVRPTVRLGVPLVDAMRSGGKESVLCGTCLMATKVRLEKTRGQEAEGLPD